MSVPLKVDWAVIRVLHAKGERIADLAKRFGISANTIYARSYREHWDVVSGNVKDDAVELAKDIWTERRAATKEKIHAIGEKMLDAAKDLAGDQLLTKADKVKIATEIAGKVVGLDQAEEKNVLNINLLSQLSESQPINGTISMLHSEPLQIQDA
jgi:transposase-like protein